MQIAQQNILAAFTLLRLMVLGRFRLQEGYVVDLSAPLTPLDIVVGWMHAEVQAT